MWTERTEQLYGKEKMAKIRQARILIVGTGGVGAYAAEMLCRAGIGHLTLMDADVVSESNINRQLPALHSTIGQNKVDVLAARFRDIHPQIDLTLKVEYLTPEGVEALLENDTYDFVIDAIDTIQPKIALLVGCLRRRLPVIASMGAGAKTDITQIQYANIWDTYHCGLSKSVRNGLKQAGFLHCKLPVVFCTQPTDRQALLSVEGERNKKTTAGTVSYMTATFGNYLAAYVLQHLCG